MRQSHTETCARTHRHKGLDSPNETGVEENYKLEEIERVCVWVHELVRQSCLWERQKEMPLPLPPTCSCNPLCFGDLGNPVTKHSWCPFDWGHRWAWSLERLGSQWRRQSAMGEEEDEVAVALWVGHFVQLFSRVSIFFPFPFNSLIGVKTFHIKTQKGYYWQNYYSSSFTFATEKYVFKTFINWIMLWLCSYEYQII